MQGMDVAEWRDGAGVRTANSRRDKKTYMDLYIRSLEFLILEFRGREVWGWTSSTSTEGDRSRGGQAVCRPAPSSTAGLPPAWLVVTLQASHLLGPVSDELASSLALSVAPFPARLVPTGSAIAPCVHLTPMR